MLVSNWSGSKMTWTDLHVFICVCVWYLLYIWDFPGGAVVKNPPAHAGDTRYISSISGKISWSRNGSWLQYSYLENSMYRGAGQAQVHGVTRSNTWLSDWIHIHTQTYVYMSIWAFRVFLNCLPKVNVYIAS